MGRRVVCCLMTAENRFEQTARKNQTARRQAPGSDAEIRNGSRLQPVAGFEPALMMEAKAVAVVPTGTERETGKVAEKIEVLISLEL